MSSTIFPKQHPDMWRFAVIGDPIEHSLSPRLHCHLMESVGISGDYSKIHVQNKQDLVGVIHRLRKGYFNGINITSPWKQTVFDLVDSYTETAKLAGVINTIKSTNGTLTGHNTDIYGFRASLDYHFNLNDLSNTGITIFGAGGSVRAVLLALERMGATNISILNRTPENAHQVISELGMEQKVVVHPLDKRSAAQALDDSYFVINALPSQGRALVNKLEFPPITEPDKIYFDIIYTPDTLQLLAKAKRANWSFADGLEMLIFQGVKSLEFWTGEQIEDSLNVDELRTHLQSN